MARMRRYDLFEEDGFGPVTSVEGEEPLPERETAGRRRRPEDAGEPRRRRAFDPAEEEPYEPAFGGRTRSSGNAPLFDDFDRQEAPLPLRNRKPKKRTKHRGAWIAVIVLCCLLLTGCGLLILPQATGIRYRFLPNFAFANGSVIRLDTERTETFAACREALYTDRIYPGVYIDDLQVGGMTKTEAAAAVTAQSDMSAVDFDITVTVGNQSWHVNQERVPVTRNVEAMVEKAWALARGNTPGLRGSGKTPFQERIDAASSLRSFPVSLKTEKTYDRAALRALVEGIVAYVNRDPVNATVTSFDFGTKTFTFSDDQPGAYLDADDLFARVAARLDAGEKNGDIFVTPEKRIAAVTKTELMNNFGLIATYTTSTTKNNNRNTNILLSAQAINGMTVLPGEIFSFNAATGERTAAKGYKEAAAISGGQSRDEIGGGVCQTSSTLFNAVARADLEIVDRNPHAWPSSYVEKGFDATVNWPGLDFKFKNNTDWPIFLVAGYENRKVTVSVYGMGLGKDTRIDLESETVRTSPQPEGVNYVVNTALAPGESKKTVTGRKGYVVDTWKVWYNGNREVKREILFKTTYKAYQETVEYNPN